MTMKLFASSRVAEPEKHKYVSLIEFSLKNPNFSATKACSVCGLSEKEFRFVASSIYVLNAYQTDPSFDPNRELEWIIKPEAYFSYLQYLEFCHAIETAKRAYWLSVAAITTAIIAAALAIK
jgi:hypothetical protein